MLPNIFPHGGGVEDAARKWDCVPEDIVDISTGLHPDGAPDWLPDWLRDHADLAARYPDAAQEPARSALAAYFSVHVDEVCVLSGAQAAIDVLVQAMGWTSLAIQAPCYQEPIRCAQRAGCTVRPFLEGQAIPDADALWWTMPHNPTGVMQPYPQGYTGVLDESYLPFQMRRTMGIVPSAVRLGSLTKTFGIPGLRLGYVIAERSMVARIAHWLPVWSVGTLNLHLLPRLLQDADVRDARIVHARGRLQDLLQQYHWQYRASQASFVLATPAAEMPDFAKHRILVRMFPEWAELLGKVRLGLPQNESAWQRLEAALCL